jgi:NAD(P)-dependent dehydrogenase (short-subunit alcohol dehydrogenase family)
VGLYGALKSVLITGCSSGFGKQMVHRFLAAGWQVLATTRQPEKLIVDQSLARKLQILPYNVASQTDRNSIIEHVNETLPSGLDCLVNNAGYGLAGPLEALTEEQIRQQFEVNFFTPLLLTQGLLPKLRENRGKVINISSVLGFTGMPMQSLYTASKFALEGLSDSLYYELASHGVQVVLVEPGGFRTGFAQGMDWASGTMPESRLYQQQFTGYRNFLDRLSTQGKGNNPDHVARIVLKLANQSSIPLRVRIGRDTQVIYYLKRLLPQKFANQILKRMCSRLLGVQ